MKKKRSSKVTKSRSSKKRKAAVIAKKATTVVFEAPVKHDAILYAHVKKENKSFIAKQAKAQKLTVSVFMDQYIDHMRANA
jgi:hypothetical protein